MATNYTLDSLSNMADTGMTEELWALVKDDAKCMQKMQIGNDKQRNLYFYLDNFCDDLCEEFSHDADDMRNDIVENAFLRLKNKKDLDLTDIRDAVYKAIHKNPLTRKLAYPNTTGAMETNIKPRRNVTKWIKTLADVYTLTQQGDEDMSATEKLTEGWSPMEKNDFTAWRRYYEKQDHEKYAMKKEAEVPSLLPTPQLTNKPTEVPLETPVDGQQQIRQPGRPRKKRMNSEETRRALISRLDSADKLLRDFSSVWPTAVWNRLHQSLTDLKREIMMLRSATSMSDRIIRTAAIWKSDGFKEGASFLEKVALPVEDVTTQIEKALTGKEYGSKPSSAPLPGTDTPTPSPDDMEGMMPEIGADMSSEEMAAIPPAGAGEDLPPDEPMPEDKEEKMPEMPELADTTEIIDEKVAPIEESVLPTNESGNPFDSATIQDVLDVLEPVSKKLKSRVNERELSKADMMLDAQNIASHFPELGETMAKALESNTYMVTRLDKIISKLKGGVTDENNKENKKESEAPPINMEELTEELPKEKTVMEVGEIEEPLVPENNDVSLSTRR